MNIFDSISRHLDKTFINIFLLLNKIKKKKSWCKTETFLKRKEEKKYGESSMNLALFPKCLIWHLCRLKKRQCELNVIGFFLLKIETFFVKPAVFVWSMCNLKLFISTLDSSVMVMVLGKWQNTLASDPTLAKILASPADGASHGLIWK